MSKELDPATIPDSLPETLAVLKQHLGQEIEAYKQIDTTDMSAGRLALHALHARILQTEAKFIQDISEVA